ncbi:MAG TPA: DUF4386 domain-containing protein [Terriglobales bacterium]
MHPTVKNARIAGALYVLLGIVGPLRLIYIPNKLFVAGNATATANNIAAHETLFRVGILSDLIGATIVIFVTLALYRLLKDVDQGLAVVMVILGSLMVTPIYFVNTINDAAALLFARGADFLSVFDSAQRDAFAMVFLRLHHAGVLANEIFWGLWLFPLGLLIYRSRFLPRFLGVWLMLACFAYLALSFTGILVPQYEDKVFTFTQPLMLGEVATMLWLLIRGANVKRAAAAAA